MEKTDWTKYYQTPYKTAAISRKITGRRLVRIIKKYIHNPGGISLTELGGANSAFLELLMDELNPAAYVIVDNNCAGLEKTKQRIKKGDNVVLLNRDILNSNFEDLLSDLALSIGVIEHFDEKDIQKAVKVHFDVLKKNGLAVITFPTPTVLYKIARFISERLGLWIFHDERPLQIKEVLKIAAEYGDQLEYSIIWPIVFTQAVVVFRKK